MNTTEFSKMLSEVKDEATLKDMNRMLIERLKDIRRSADLDNMSMLRGLTPGTRIEIRWKDHYTYHGIFEELRRTKVAAKVDEMGGKSYLLPPSWITRVIEEETGTKGGAKVEKIPLPTDDTERTAEAFAIRDAANELHGSSISSGADSWLKQQQQIWERMEKLDERSKPGLRVGRLCSWPEADGYAQYIVVGFTGRRVKMLHILYMDGYQSPAVDSNGYASRSTVEENLRRHEALKKLFPGKKAANG